jgi:hypothetical protein
VENVRATYGLQWGIIAWCPEPSLGFSPQICAAASLILGSEMNLKGFTSWASHLFRLAHFFLAQLPAG